MAKHQNRFDIGVCLDDDLYYRVTSVKGGTTREEVRRVCAEVVEMIDKRSGAEAPARKETEPR